MEPNKGSIYWHGHLRNRGHVGTMSSTHHSHSNRASIQPALLQIRTINSTETLPRGIKFNLKLDNLRLCEALQKYGMYNISIWGVIRSWNLNLHHRKGLNPTASAQLGDVQGSNIVLLVSLLEHYILRGLAHYIWSCSNAKISTGLIIV